jgi:predicted O-linked N-acetylglucosamine transferase (SPINDLY family)
LQKRNFENFIYNLNIKKNISFNLQKKNKIKVGYISHDFMRHPVSQLISDTFEMHNKDKFDIYAFKLNALSDNFTKKISRSTNLIDLSSYKLDKISSTIKKFEIDIDLMKVIKFLVENNQVSENDILPGLELNTEIWYGREELSIEKLNYKIIKKNN